MFIFVFIVHTLRGGSEKMVLSFMSESVWPMFSSKSFIRSGLTSRSLIHFEFTFVFGVRECSHFILFPAPLIEQAVLSPLYSLASFVIDELAVSAWV